MHEGIAAAPQTRLPAPPAGAVPVFAESCTRARWRRSGCRRCQDMCPAGAISLNPAAAIGESCVRCGLCRAACPTGAFGDDPGQAAAGEMECRADRSLVIACADARQPASTVLRIRCLAFVTEEPLLAAASSGASRIELASGDCARCRLRSGIGLVAESLANYRALACALGLDPSAVRIVTRAKSERPQIDRRGFFAAILGRSPEREGASPAGIEGPENPRLGKRNTSEYDPAVGARSRRERLRGLLQAIAPPESVQVVCSSDSPWASLRVDTRRCDLCGVCAAVCPTKALSTHADPDRLSLSFAAASCVNCRACAAACPERAVRFEPHLSLQALARSEPAILAQRPSAACPGCGEPVALDLGTLCPTCRKRQFDPLRLAAQQPVSS